MAKKHARRFAQMNTIVPESVVMSWEKQIQDWDALESKKKHAKNSPYRDPVHGKFRCPF